MSWALDLANVISRGPRSTTSAGKSSSSLGDDPAKIIDILVSNGYPRDDCVEWVSTITPRKRKRTSSADSKGHVPSDLTVWEVWRKYTGGESPVFKCRRPLTSAPPIPLVLLHKPFMDFLVNVKTGEPDDVDLGFAWSFWEAVHGDEYVEDHTNVAEEIGVYLMNRYFNRDKPVVAAAHEARVGGTKLDVIHMKGPYFPIIDEFKSQAVAGEPAMQNLDGFRRAWSGERSYGGVEYQAYSLLLNIHGNFCVEVMAASLQSGEVWAETVATFVCYPTAEGPMEELLHSARVWRAIRLFASEYESMQKQESVPWCLSGFREVKQPDKRRLFFTHRDEQGVVKAAKICRTYSEAAHRAWQKFAPALDRVQELPCGWKVAHMEYLAPEHMWTSAWCVMQAATVKGRMETVDRFKERLKEAAKAGHDQGYVHGDFRLCNMMLRGLGPVDQEGFYEDYEVRVVDFDWAGKAGEAMYPALLSESFSWCAGAGYKLPITKEHDFWFLDGEGLLQQLFDCSSELKKVGYSF